MSKKRLERLDSVPEAYTKRVAKSQSELFRKVVALIESLERKNGDIVISEKNLTKVSTIINELRATLSSSEYFKATKSFIKEFNTQAGLVEADFKAIDMMATDLSKAVFLSAKNDAIQSLLSESALTQELMRPLQKTLNNAISTGASYHDTVDALRSITVGDSERLGKLHRYSKQIASDAFAVSDRNYSRSIAKENGAVWYRYLGGTIADTRDFCSQRDGNYYHENEVMEWADDDWQGKISGTNSSNIFSNLGGYNCKHSLVAVSVFAVPSDVIQRNIENGNFEPTENEAKILGL